MLGARAVAQAKQTGQTQTRRSLVVNAGPQPQLGQACQAAAHARQQAADGVRAEGVHGVPVSLQRPQRRERVERLDELHVARHLPQPHRAQPRAAVRGDGGDELLAAVHVPRANRHGALARAVHLDVDAVQARQD